MRFKKEEKHQTPEPLNQEQIDAYKRVATRLKHQYSHSASEKQQETIKPGVPDPFQLEQEAETQNQSDNGREEKALLVSLAKEGLKEKELRNTQLKDTIDLRKDLANKIFWFVVISTCLVGAIVVASGFKSYIKSPDGRLIDQFTLSDKVLIALITAVTINVMAGLIVVMKNLFPAPSQTEKKQDKTCQ